MEAPIKWCAALGRRVRRGGVISAPGWPVVIARTRGHRATMPARSCCAAPRYATARDVQPLPARVPASPSGGGGGHPPAAADGAVVCRVVVVVVLTAPSSRTPRPRRRRCRRPRSARPWRSLRRWSPRAPSCPRRAWPCGRGPSTPRRRTGPRRPGTGKRRSRQRWRTSGSKAQRSRRPCREMGRGWGQPTRDVGGKTRLVGLRPNQPAAGAAGGTGIIAGPRRHHRRHYALVADDAVGHALVEDDARGVEGDAVDGARVVLAHGDARDGVVEVAARGLDILLDGADLDEGAAGCGVRKGDGAGEREGSAVRRAAGAQ